MKTKKLMLGLSCLMMTAGLMPVANAATATGKLQVKVTIGGSACSLTSGNNSVVDFGNVTDLTKPQFAVSSSSSGIELQCSKDVKYSIGLDSGQSPTADKKIRRMKSGTNFQQYYLYKDKDHTLEWGDATPIGSAVSAVGDGTIQKYPVYAGIAGPTLPAAGLYTDIVSVVVTY